MNLTIKELEDYLLDHYSNGGIDQSLFMKLVEENGIDINDVILDKDKEASIKYNHSINLEQFILNKRNQI